MKLFHQLLVAPAALGFLAPLSVDASDLNIHGVSNYAATGERSMARSPVGKGTVSDYTATGEQVTSITQFSDVYPTDWAYQALSNLIERYGCVAGYPNGTYRGNRAMTRFEAAALLNACLDRVTEVTDELKRLMKEFEKELAILKGRVDGLEARVGELEATQFSTTTKLKGQATFVLGANSYGGNAKAIYSPYVSPLAVPPGVALLPPEKRADVTAANSGATSFNYDLQLFLDTSFTGKDLLRTVLRAGNFQNSTFGDSNFRNGDGNTVYRRGGVGLNSLAVAFQEPEDPNNVSVNRLFYQFPVGSSFTATVGGIVRQDDMLAVWPSAYPADSILEIFTYAGAPGAYNLALGSGAGLWWESDDFSISGSYISANGSFSQPSKTYDPNTGSMSCWNSGGIANDCAASVGTIQVAYAPENWGVAAAYNYSSGNNNPSKSAGSGTPFANALSSLGVVNSLGLSAWWTPEESGWIPSISTGWGLSQSSQFKNSYLLTPFLSPAQNASSTRLEVNSFTSQSWYVGLQWSDVFLQGNTLGLAVGQPTFVTAVDFESDSESDFVADGNYAMELWYAFQVTDNITVTPAIYYLSRPLGQLTNGAAGVTGSRDDTFNNFGGILKTSFKF